MTFRQYTIVISTINIFLFSSFISATIINVPVDQPTIQQGLNAAQSGDTVLVRPDTYTENIIWPTVNGIKLISAGDSSNTIIDGGGMNSVIRILSSAIGESTLIEGFKIQNQNIDMRVGSGIYLEGSSPTISNVSFTDNSAPEGGGMKCVNSSPVLNNVSFTGNAALQGGGMYLYNSSPTLTNVSFTDNYANSGGGMFVRENSNPIISRVTITGNTADNGSGMYLWRSSPILTNVTITGNSASGWGGGMYLYNYSSPTLTNVTIANNTAKSAGGILSKGNCNPTFTNVIITGNSVNQYGGGMYLEGSTPNLAITDVTIADNIASEWGGGMYLYASSPTLTNVTIAGNSANGYGGGMVVRNNSSPTLTYVTISGNSANPYGGGMYSLLANPTIGYSNIAYNSSGLYNADNSIIIDAVGNYWGHFSGPYHPTQNTYGQGDNTNQYVNVTPWLVEADTAAPPLPVQNTTITGTSNDFISLNWDASIVGDLAGYKVFYDTDASGYPYTYSVDVGTDTTYIISGLAAGTTHYLSVTVYDTDGNESWYSKEVSATLRVIEIRNLDVAGVEDSQHIINHTPDITYTFYDDSEESQASYHIQVSSYADFSDMDFWDTGVVTSDDTVITYAGNSLLDGQSYYLRVKATSGEYWSEWKSFAFRMNSKPLSPISIFPVNDTVVVPPINLTVRSSSDDEGDELLYSFFVYEDEEMTTLLDSVINMADTSWQVTNSLPNNGQYWWVCKTNDSYEESNFSSPSSFIIETVSIDESKLIPDEYALRQNFPNPFNPITTIRYELPENSFVHITIYDMLGRQVRTLINKTQNAGYKSVIWNATNDNGKLVSAGVYLYKIQAGEFVQTKKIVLLK